MEHKNRMIYGLWIFRVLFYGGIVCMVVPLFRQKLSLIWVGAVIVIVSVIVADLTVRCPACGEPLTVGRLPGIPRFCPNCGKRLKEE